jgi:hypothetical protein
MSKLFYHFKNFIEVATKHMNNLMVYFLLKNYAFKMVYSTLSSNNNALNESEKLIFEQFNSEFQNEKHQNPNMPLLTVDQYKSFLEEYFKNINFEQADLHTINICKDLTEVLAIYGPMDELYKKRSNLN